MFTEPKQKHILIVEDEMDMRDSLQTSLRASGYEATAVKNSAEALEHMAEIKPDLILLDILTNSIDAGLFMQKLRNLPLELGSTKVVVLTNLDDSDTRAEMEKYGIEAYLIKINVSLEDILNSIETALLPIDRTTNSSPILR